MTYTQIQKLKHVKYLKFIEENNRELHMIVVPLIYDVVTNHLALDLM